jgi:hypothetical protein
MHIAHYGISKVSNQKKISENRRQICHQPVQQVQLWKMFSELNSGGIVIPFTETLMREAAVAMFC